jgi:hypothetical protein
MDEARKEMERCMSFMRTQHDKVEEWKGILPLRSHLCALPPSKGRVTPESASSHRGPTVFAFHMISW